MTLKELLNKLTQQAKKRKPTTPVETNGMKSKGVPIND
jgi:hypothetical protein